VREHRPRIVVEDGGFTVVWHTSRTSGRSFTFAAFVPDQGAPGTPRQLHEWIGVTASVAVTDNGGPSLLLTAVHRTGAVSMDLFAQTVSEFGVTSPVSLAFSPTEQGRVAAAAGQNGYLAAWVERGPGAFERMMVRREDIGAAILQHEARETEPTTDLENALARDRIPAHRFGQHAAGRPDLAEQAPLRRRDADAFRVAIRIGELLKIAQRADAEIVSAEAQDEQASGVARHGAPGKPHPMRGDAEQRGETATGEIGRADRA
jgi:hypothetical protein